MNNFKNFIKTLLVIFIVIILYFNFSLHYHPRIYTDNNPPYNASLYMQQALMFLDKETDSIGADVAGAEQAI